MLGRVYFSLLVCAAISVPGLARGQSDVAFPLVTGPKPAGRGATAKGVVAALDRAGLSHVRGDALEEAAEELGVAVYSAEVAMAVACEYMAVVRLRGSRGRFVAKGTLLRAADGSVVVEVERKYRGKRRATKTGQAIGKRFVRAIKADRRGRPSVAGEAPNVLAPPPSRAITPTVDEADTSMGMRDRRSETSQAPAAAPAPRTDFARRTEPPPASVSERRPRRRSNLARPERKLLRLSVGAGARTLAGYSITVGGEPTSHNYTLEPLLAVGAHAVFTLPDMGFLAEADFGFMPVQFQIATMPPVDPADPGGQFLEVGGNLGWRFDVAQVGERGAFTVTPLVGADYGALLVTDQGVQTVVNAWSTLALGGGLRAGLEINENLAFDIDGELGAIISFDESPVITGESGSGLRFGTRFRARYWLSELLGIELGAAYQFRSVDLQGAANRATFTDDPEIMNANVGSESLDFLVGAVLAI